MSEAVVIKMNDVEIGKVASLAAKIQQEPHVANTKWRADVKGSVYETYASMVCSF